MELQINRDPQDLNKSALAGRKWWQYACIISAIVFAVIFTLLFQKYLGNTLNSIICGIIVVPLGYIGLFRKNGLDYFEYRRKKKNKSGNIYLYESVPYKKRNEAVKKKHGIKYFVVNIATGGKYAD